MVSHDPASPPLLQASPITPNPPDELGLRMILLPELTDEILTHLQDDERTLQNCSLVAKSWVHSSQKPLYSHVHLTPVTHRTWRKKVSPTSGVMQHVRTLSCRGLDSLHSFHGDFFKSLHLLERLDFHGSMRIEPNVTNLFTTFQTTLSSLSLSGVSATWGALVNVVDYFPNLRDLHLGQSSFVGGCWGVPPLSRPTRGKLCLFTLSSVDMSILSAGLSASKLQYNELEIIDVVGPTPSRAIIPIISACRKTLTRLVLGSYDCKFRYHRVPCDQHHLIYRFDSIQHLTIPLSRSAQSFANSCSSRRGKYRRNPLSSHQLPP